MLDRRACCERLTQPLDKLHTIGRVQCRRDARLACACSPSDSVHELDSVGGDVVLNDVRHVDKIDAARGEASADERARPAVSESLQLCSTLADCTGRGVVKTHE